MIGNDIVDIAKTKRSSNHLRARFLEKLFTSREQKIIEKSKDPFVQVWTLWSMKEAAYKVYTQIQPSRFYNPRGFECFVDQFQNKVQYQDFECDVRTTECDCYILSEAYLENSNISRSTIKFSNDNINDQSTILKEALLEAISKKYHSSRHSIRYHKSAFGVPQVFMDLKRINVSLTHHGNYGAFAFSEAWND